MQMSTPLLPLDPHPGICANKIGRYVISRLKADTINLYSAYLLMHEALRLKRRCYTLPAWGRTLSITGLLEIYFDYLTGMALKCAREATESAEWFVADLSLLHEKRAHFLVDGLSLGRSLLTDRTFHQRLSTLRGDYDNLSADDGPFPLEVFPWHFAAPERELLHPGSEVPFQGVLELDSDSSELYVQLQINNA